MSAFPENGGRVGPRIVLFEACSAFTRVTACTLAASPYFVTRWSPEASTASLPPQLLRLLPAGASRRVGDFHPLEGAAFSRRTPLADVPGVPFVSVANPLVLRLNDNLVMPKTLQPAAYWSGRQVSLVPGAAWDLNLSTGFQDNSSNEADEYLALPVAPGTLPPHLSPPL
jgi:hypothetical protein